MIWVGVAAAVLAVGAGVGLLIGLGIHHADVEAGFALDEWGQS